MQAGQVVLMSNEGFLTCQQVILSICQLLKSLTEKKLSVAFSISLKMLDLESFEIPVLPVGH